MKKVLIGLFLVASLGVLGAKNQTLDTANDVKKGKYFFRAFSITFLLFLKKGG